MKPQSYTTNEIVEVLKLQGNGEKLNEYVIANHINKFAAYFCNSEKQKIQDLNYLDAVLDKKAKEFVLSSYDYIQVSNPTVLEKDGTGRDRNNP